MGGGAIVCLDGGGTMEFGSEIVCRVGVSGGEAVMGVDGGERALKRDDVGVPGWDELDKEEELVYDAGMVSG